MWYNKSVFILVFSTHLFEPQKEEIFALNYLNQLTERLNHHKKILPACVLCTMAALALALVVTVVGVIVSLATDSEAPVIEGPAGDVAVVYVGDNVAYKSFVKVTDNRDDYTLEIDQGQVNLDREGTYRVTYVATDGAGNETTYVLRLTVKSRQYSEDALMALVAQKAEALGMSADMSKTELVRMIYDYVNSPAHGPNEANIYFSDESNTPNQYNQSGIRKDWETDWVEEAVRTLQMDRMKGDCYTYYSVSKAFFEYFGIENIGIQRSDDSAEDGTHFWSVVNVGSGDAPKWYYYDSTRLGGSFTSDGKKNACLITEEKLTSYRTSTGGDGFYTFDKPSGFPTVARKELSN